MSTIADTGPPPAGALRVCETRSVLENTNASGTAGSHTLRRIARFLQGGTP
jgi:hypothetical protein